MPEPVHIRPAERDRGGPISRAVAEFAGRQFGVITLAQLVACGLSRSAIGRWAQSGRLHRLYPGVYAVGHAVLVPAGQRLAAVLACGDGAALSHTDAGAVWGACAARGSRFHVTVPRGGAQSGPRQGIHVHVGPASGFDVVVHDGIPVTSLAQTLLDLATILSDERLADAVDRTIAHGLYNQTAVDAVCGRGRRGTAKLRRVIADRHPDAQATKSEWEKAMLRLIDQHRLPRPQVNPMLSAHGISPDLLWPVPRVVVEWDSWTHHRTRDRFESDRRKTIDLQAAGYTVLRFTWRHTQHDPDWVISAIRTALARTGPYPTR